MIEIISSKIHIARKEYSCDWCNSPICVGEKYSRETIVDDGLYEWKSHTKCTEFACKYLFNEIDEASDSEFCDCVNDIASGMSLNTDLSTYELVKLIIEEEDEKLREKLVETIDDWNSRS